MAIANRPSGWTHVVLNYIGPNDEEGIKIYYNGIQTAYDKIKEVDTYEPGNGQVVLGRQFIDKDSLYTVADVDELLFFNEALSDQNIQYMNN